MKNSKYVVVAVLCLAIIILVAHFIMSYIEFQTKVTTVPQLVEQAIPPKEKLASSMNENETTQYLMEQIYQSDRFISNDAYQLPSVSDENIKNRLLWKPSEQEIVTNPDWAETFKYPSEDGTPPGYFMASPMLFHIYEDQGMTYASIFSQSATRGYSHASGADIGAGVFKKENDAWKPIFISKNINDGVGSTGNAGTISPFMIGENKYAYEVELSNIAQGDSFYHHDFYYFDGKTFKEILSFRVKEGEGSNCSNKTNETNPWAETVEMKKDKVQGSDFYDIVLKWGGYEARGSYGECYVFPVEKGVETYHWTGLKYELEK